MEQAPYWMWTKPKPSLSTHKNLQLQAYDRTWEEQAFAEDVSGALGGGEGYTWPPRSYSCSFCRREFRSAQALGGHMNVHRRDRARLKQSSPPDHLGFQYHNPNPNPDSWPSRVLSNNNFDDHSEDPQITILGDDCVKSDLSVSLSLVLHQSTHDTTVSSDGDEEEATRSCKKRRIMSSSDESSLPFFLKLNCPIKKLHDDHDAAAAGDQLLDGFSPNTTLTDIDLELRLGDRPKWRHKFAVGLLVDVRAERQEPGGGGREKEGGLEGGDGLVRIVESAFDFVVGTDDINDGDERRLAKHFM